MLHAIPLQSRVFYFKQACNTVYTRTAILRVVVTAPVCVRARAETTTHMAVTYPGWQPPSLPPSSRKAPILSLVALTQNRGWAPTASGNTSVALRRALRNKTWSRTRPWRPTQACLKEGAPSMCTYKHTGVLAEPKKPCCVCGQPPFSHGKKSLIKVPLKAPLWISPPTLLVWQSGSQEIYLDFTFRCQKEKKHPYRDTYMQTHW